MNWFVDLRVIYNLLTAPFKRANSQKHQDKLESFYKDQAQYYDEYRERLLWGRNPMLQTCASYLSKSCERTHLVWVDMGGGTGYNVEEMDKYYSLKHFKKVYIVDLCPSLCEEARKRVQRKQWDNVEVVCCDVCDFKLDNEYADLLTFSYSLSMIPTFYKAIDNASSLLASDGLVASTDFYVSDKIEQDHRKMSWWQRVFWQTFFDIDGVRLGPERRQYLEHVFQTLHEHNDYGSVPYMMVKAPYYIWIGGKSDVGLFKSSVCIKNTKAPSLFPSTFLYHQSWEDPIPDHKVLNITQNDVCLSLTSGGCNVLELLLQGAKQVVSVDINPAQNALLELKCVAIKHLDYENFWKLFGEGRHEDFDAIYNRDLAPFLSETSRKFWDDKRYYFTDGLYYHGSMGKVAKVVQTLVSFFGLKSYLMELISCSSLEEQQNVWNELKKRNLNTRTHGKALLEKVFSLLFFNKAVTWFAGGVPKKQFELIKKDGMQVSDYFYRCIDNVFTNVLMSDNHFYYNILNGRYSKKTCPAYLKEENFLKLKNTDMLDHLIISTDYFVNEVRKRKYDKVILMDHIDWLDNKSASELVKALYDHVNTNGVMILRSASLCPFYISLFKDIGFTASELDRIDKTGYMDRVNMYASFYSCKKLNG
jgi:betaine lipid synthase